MSTLLLVLTAGLLLAPEDGLVDSKKYGLHIEAPVGWTTRAMPYPQVVAAFKDGRGGEMVLTAESSPPGDTLPKMLSRNRAALEKMGWGIRRQGVSPIGPHVSELTALRGEAAILQIYSILGDSGFVLTLSAPSQKLEGYLRDVYRTWKTMTFAGTLEGEGPEPTVDPAAGPIVAPGSTAAPDRPASKEPSRR